MATYNYLDKTGLSQVWAKIKNKYLEVFVVNFERDENGALVADKTYNEIQEAMFSGLTVIFKTHDVRLGTKTAVASALDADRYVDYCADFYYREYSERINKKLTITFSHKRTITETISDVSDVVPDWDIPEGYPGNILNRPMWLDLYYTTIFNSEGPTAFVIPSSGSIEVTPIISYEYSRLYLRGQVIIVTDSETITSRIDYDSTNNFYYCNLDTSDFILRFYEDKVELVSMLDYGRTYNISEIMVQYYEVQVKDEYKSVFQADWAETDSTYGDYIKNKPPIHPGTGANSTIIGDKNNQARGGVSIASGYGNTSSGGYSVTNGYNNTASNMYAIANGSGNTASGKYAVATGQNNKSTNNYSIAHGSYSEASGTYAVALGSAVKSSGYSSLAFGAEERIGSGFLFTGEASATTYSTLCNNQNTVDNIKRLGTSLFVRVNGKPIRVTNITDGDADLEVLITFESTLSDIALSEKPFTLYDASMATGDAAIAMGISCVASGQGAVALGANNISSSIASFAEGKWTTASNLQSHAEGFGTVSSSNQSHAEGRYTTASALAAHSEGHGTTASGEASHSENKSTVASGKYTHAQGENTTANGYAETTIGRFNALSNASAQTAYNTTNSPYILVAGNGTTDDSRSNAYTLDWSGNGWYAGKLTVGTAPTNNMDVATKKYVDDNVEAIPQPEDDTNVLNLLSEFGYSAPVADADNKIITDADNNIVLG